MNERILTLVSIVFIVTSVVMIQKTEAQQKGASATAQQRAGDNAVFNRIGDWFATIGKSEEEKTKILAERKAERAAKKAEKVMMKKKAEAQRKVKDTKNKTMNKGSKKKGS